jgi:FixJ family two-component response regulator
MNRVTGTVFIVDDAPEVCGSLSRVLTASGYQVRTFESAEAFLEKHEADASGCILLDIGLPGLSGIELQRVLAYSPNTLPIVFLTGLGDIRTSVDAMKEGAVDFLCKPIDHLRLFAALDRALQRNVEQQTQVKLQRMIHQRLDTLTLRERQVMTHVIHGRLNKQIAADLGAGEKTIKVHRARMMSKMRVRSVSELVALVARVGMTICPALDIGSGSFSWRRPDIQSTKATQRTPPRSSCGAR